MSTDKFLNEFCDIIDTYGGRDKVIEFRTSPFIVIVNKSNYS